MMTLFMLYARDTKSCAGDKAGIVHQYQPHYFQNNYYNKLDLIGCRLSMMMRQTIIIIRLISVRIWRYALLVYS